MKGIGGGGLMGACGLGVMRDVKDIDGGCGTSGGEADAVRRLWSQGALASSTAS